MAFGWVHGYVERVLRLLDLCGCKFEGRVAYAADDLMQMRRWVRAGVDQRIEALDGELCAAEAQEAGIGGSEEPKGSDEEV